MNTRTQKSSDDIIDAIRLHHIANSQLDYRTLNVRAHARMEQIMATNPAQPQLVHNSRRFSIRPNRVRRVAFASVASLAVGLGGLTAASAAGLDNPVGHWIITGLRPDAAQTVGQNECDSMPGLLHRVDGNWVAIHESEVAQSRDLQIAVTAFESFDINDFEGATVSVERWYTPEEIEQLSAAFATADDAEYMISLQLGLGVDQPDSIHTEHQFVIYTTDAQTRLVEEFNSKLVAAGVDPGLFTFVQITDEC